MSHHHTGTLVERGAGASVATPPTIMRRNGSAWSNGYGFAVLCAAAVLTAAAAGGALAKGIAAPRPVDVIASGSRAGIVLGFTLIVGVNMVPHLLRGAPNTDGIWMRARGVGIVT